MDTLMEHYKGLLAITYIKLSKNAKKRKNIPKKLKIEVWNKYIGLENGVGECYVCKDSIDLKHFEAGHINAESEGETTTKDNLRPICEICNKSIGNMNMNEYKEKYYKSL